MDGSLAEKGINPLYPLKYLDVTFSFASGKDTIFCAAVMVRNMKKKRKEKRAH